MKGFMRITVRILISFILGLALTANSIVYAANTGARTAGASAAVTSSAGDNNGFEILFGSSPTDTTTSNDSGIRSTNSGTGASSSCSTATTNSDKHDFTNFGISIPEGAVVVGIVVAIEGRYDSNSGVNTVCAHLSYDGGSNWSSGQNTADMGNTDSTQTLGSSADLWGRSSWSATELNDINFKLRLMTLVANTARDFLLDYLTVTVYYNESPNSPSLDLPANGASAVSLNPTFKMTASDNDSDKLGYKVTIYSDSGCTSVVQTNDQAVGSTGWSGTNTTCTNNPTDCYTSGTQATYQAQTPLVANTQYWWRPSAKDPDGTGNFADGASCNSFTTALISVSVADGVVSYGLVGLGSSKDTTAGGLNDTQTATNNGNAAENLNIKGQNSANWTLASSSGVNIYVHDFCIAGSGSPDPCDSSPSWVPLTTNYQTLATGLAVSAGQKFDLRITTASSTSSNNQQSVDVTIQAVSP